MTDEAILKHTLQSLFDNMHVLVFVKDLSGRFIKVNQAVADLHGVKPEDLAGRTLFDVYGEEAARYFEDDRRVIQSGKPMLNIVEPLQVRDGRVLTIEASKMPIRDDEGRVVGVLVIATDITEKQEADRLLAESRSLLETVVNSIEAPVGFYGPDHRLEFGNKAYWNIHDRMGTRDVVKVGTRFEDITRATVDRAVVLENDAERQALIQRFLDDFENPQGGMTVQQKGRWYQHHRYRTPSGGRVTFAYDVTDVKQAEQDLRESQELLQAVVENFSEMLALHSPDGCLLFGNRTFWQFHEEAGTKEVMKVGRHFDINARAMVDRLAEADPGFDADAIFNDIMRLPVEENCHVEFPLGKRIIRLRQYPIPEGGRVTFGHDVTDYTKAEAALKLSNERFRDFAESASDWFWEIDEELRYTWASDRIVDALGYAGELIYGRRRSDLIDVQADPEDWAAHQQTVRQRKPFKDFVYRIDPGSLPLGEGAVQWVKTSGVPVFHSDGSFAGYRGTGSNVTREKLAEEDLKESRRRYHTLAQTAPVAIFRTDEAGVCTYHNEVWGKIAGPKRLAAPPANWTTMFAADDRERISAVWYDTAVREGIYRTEGRIAREQGDEIWVLATIAIEECPAGGSCTFVGTLTDISQLKRIERRLRVTEQALREHRDELEILVERRTAALRDAQQSLIARERLSAIGQLTATVSHELRNPLGTISASFAALKHRVELPSEKAVAIAERIERNIKRCETIIQDLLNYTRIDTLNCESVDLDAWLTRFLGEQDLPDGMRFEVLLDGAARVCIDRSRMTQVLANLVSNAIDAMAEDPASSRKIEVETGRREGEFIIALRDDGPGIDPENLERVFEPLVSTKAFGVGLGLPLVRQIVELHGGKVQISNRPERGVEVEIVLPVEENISARKSA